MGAFLKKTAVILFVLLSLSCCAYAEHGSTTMPTETTQTITIPTQQWQTLTSEFQALNKDLTECQNVLSKLKKPSQELVSELVQAQDMLLKLQTDLELQKKDLNQLSSEVTELKSLSKTLKEQINKERKIHKRQIWQNRFWCIFIGAGIGFAVSK